MAGSTYTSQSIPLSSLQFNGGLNSTASPLDLADNQSSDLSNIDFDKFGSILKRGGYTALNTTAISGSPQSDGLAWYEWVDSAYNSYAINIADGKFWYMGGLDGTWHDITSSLTITSGYHCDFENWDNKIFVANGVDTPFYWDGAGNAKSQPTFGANTLTFLVTGVTTAPSVGDTYTYVAINSNNITLTITGVYIANGAGVIVGTTAANASLPITTGNLTRTAGSGDSSIAYEQFDVSPNITSAKFVKQFNNYLFYANVVVGTTAYPTRIYWSDLREPFMFNAANWIEVSMNDGQQITGLRVLGSSLVIYKSRSIYSLYYTGEADIPFVLPSGGKSNSPVGCNASYCIQDINNGHIFISYDGIYFFDGNNSTKLSYVIDTTWQGLNPLLLSQAVSLNYKQKNRVLFAVPKGGQSENTQVIVWDYYNQAFSLYDGMAPCSMCTFFVNQQTETPYFGDYSGFVYQMDNGLNDYPLNTKTAISAYYYTNWKARFFAVISQYADVVNQKGVPHVYIYYLLNSATLTFSYSYEFNSQDQYINTINMSGGGSMFDSAIFDSSTFGQAGGGVYRLDLTGRGRVIRYKFSNANADETFRVDGLGMYVHLETPV